MFRAIIVFVGEISSTGESNEGSHWFRANPCRIGCSGIDWWGNGGQNGKYYRFNRTTLIS